jgi:hypothetical protein
MFKNFYEELAFKFTNLSSLKPDNVKGKIASFDFVTEENVHNFNPGRYMFYLEFMKGLQDPEVLKNVIYESNLIKVKKEDESKIINEIVAKINQLHSVHDKNIMKNDQLYQRYRAEKVKKEDEQLTKRLEKVMEAYNDKPDTNNAVNGILEKTFNNGKSTSSSEPIKSQESQSRQNAGALDTTKIVDITEKDNALLEAKQILANLENDNSREKENYLTKIHKLKEKFNNDSLLVNYRDRLKAVLDAPTGDDKLKAQKLQDIIYEIEDNEATSINVLQLSKQDILVFIGLTFLIRLISLQIIDWALTSNFVVSFPQAYSLYIGIYCILILLILVIVNLTYNFSIYKLYTDKHGLFTQLAGALYYFYIVPGNTWPAILRIAVHLMLIIFITVVSLFIAYRQNDDNELNYDYSEKKRIRRALSNTTIVIWIFSSIVALFLK